LAYIRVTNGVANTQQMLFATERTWGWKAQAEKNTLEVCGHVSTKS